MGNVIKSELSDSCILSILIAAISNYNDGEILDCWDVLESRGWTDAQINTAIRTA